MSKVGEVFEAGEGVLVYHSPDAPVWKATDIMPPDPRLIEFYSRIAETALPIAEPLFVGAEDMPPVEGVSPAEWNSAVATVAMAKVYKALGGADYRSYETEAKRLTRMRLNTLMGVPPVESEVSVEEGWLSPNLNLTVEEVAHFIQRLKDAGREVMERYRATKAQKAMAAGVATATEDGDTKAVLKQLGMQTEPPPMAEYGGATYRHKPDGGS